MTIVSSNFVSVCISTDFAFSFFSILFDSFFAREKAVVGRSFAFETGDFGMIIIWPFDIGFMSRTARAFLFLSTSVEVISPSTIILKIVF